MSGLVGYESSSDEDDFSKTKSNNVSPIVPAAPNTAASSPGGDDRLGHAAPEQQQIIEQTPSRPEGDAAAAPPMVGPVWRPSDLVEPESVEAEAAPPTADGPISERDAIRYLTQPTHPMTSIPPSPPGSPDPAMNAKFSRFLELKARGVHFNQDLAKKSTFKNPSLLSTLMSRAGIEGDVQYGSSLPATLWNPLSFPPFAYKEELLRSQQSLREHEAANQRNLAASGKRVIEFTAGAGSGSTAKESIPRPQTKRIRP